MPTVGDRIREVRETLGWTQEKLAKKAGISKGFLCDVENSKRNSSAENALRIADALGASLDYLLKGEAGNEELEKQPIQIPPELSKAAEQLTLTYSETLTLLDAHRSVVARRSNTSRKKFTIKEWINLQKAIKEVFG